MIKIVHTADLHLDTVYKKIPYNKASILRCEMKEAFKNICESALNKGADFFVISGDLFENEFVSLSTINYINECFKKLKNIEVIIVPGNHDSYSDKSIYKIYNWSKNVWILADDREKVIFDDKNTVFYGSGFYSNTDKDEFEFKFEKPDKDMINVLVMHGTVDMIYSNAPINTTSSEKINNLGFDYVALGHYHNRFEKYKNCIRIYNPGSPYSLSYEDENQHGYYYIELDKENIEDTYIRLENRKFYQVEVLIDNICSEQKIIEAVYEKISQKDRKKNLYNVILKGKIDKNCILDLDSIKEKISDKVFYVEIKDKTRINIDLDSLLTEPGLKGSFVRKIYNRILREKDDEQKRILYQGLYNGLKALDDEENNMEE